MGDDSQDGHHPYFFKERLRVSKKHFDEYFNKIYLQHLQLQRALEDMTKEVEQNIVSPERIEELKKTIQPVRTAYETLLYVKYLLNMPKRKSKVNKYNKQEFSKMKSKTGNNYGPNVIKNNESVIRNLSL